MTFRPPRRASFLIPSLVALACQFSAFSALSATETENLDLQILPAGPVTIDGETGDWNLAAGMFSCGDVENLRDKFAFWANSSYDAQNLYILVRFVDPTPVNNPGQVEGDYGFNGDSLQFRLIIGGGADPRAGRTSHWTCWRGRDGKTVMNVEYGISFDGEKLKDAQAKGARQAFKMLPDKSGYVQELAVPWSLIAPDGWKPEAGAAMHLTFEPNFTVGVGGRLSVKDLFARGQPHLDRVFTFMEFRSWGTVALGKPGTVVPQPVRLSDRREFPVRMADGVPVVDWTGLIRQKVLTGDKAITFDMPFDGYISLNLFAPDGTVARQLLTTAFYTKGRHEVRWDGLTTFNWRDPGEPVPAGSYTWEALVHPGLDLKLVGWAANAGSAPWDGPLGKDNWGGDHGPPTAAAASGDTVLLGWAAAEAGKALIAVDQQGNVRWKNNRQGIASCQQVTADGRYVYAVNASGDGTKSYVYRLELANGSYAVWPGSDSPDLPVHGLLDEARRKSIPDQVSAVAARDGQLVMAAGDALLVCDGTSGALQKVIDIKAPLALAAAGKGRFYCSSGRAGVQVVDVASGRVERFCDAQDVWGIAVDGEGLVYVAARGAAQQVLVFDAAGKQVRAIGRAGGRPSPGPWQADGLRIPRGIAVDASGQLWVAEEEENPRRVSVWNAKTGALVRELFGPTIYGGLGGSISPVDPQVVAGMGSEWKIDPATGRAACLGVIDPGGFRNSRFAIAANGREYLFTAGNWAFDRSPLKVWEHLVPGIWKLRSMVVVRDQAGKEVIDGNHPEAGCTTTVWADRNDDGKQDADEFLPPVPGMLSFSDWYMRVAPDLSIYSQDRQFRVGAFTACGAPTWDLAQPTRMPAIGLGSADSTMVLRGGDYGVSHGLMECFDIASGKRRWSYPDTFVGVHGSHNAPPPEVGLVRGSFSMNNFNACGVVKLPPPLGNVWIVPTNVGEWHLLTERGFYLSRLFQPDPIKVAFPEKAVPGVLLNDVPCGMGGEDFAGSVTLARDGKLYVQAGKTGFWDVAVENLDRVRELKGAEPVVITEADLAQVRKYRDQAKQALVGIQRLAVAHGTPTTFTGDLAKDFAGVIPVVYEKGEWTRVRSALAWDDQSLHLGWEVQDRTPWVNGARSADALYWGGDTVDFQLAGDPAAAVDRAEAGKGDLRLSIGALAGNATAVLFRKVAERKQPKTFSSGVVREYVMDSVTTLDRARITVTKRNDGYTVEATIPLADLGLTPKSGLVLRGDLGATFGNQAGDRTRLRSYWSNQHVGIVDDVVIELQMEPRYWSEMSFE